MDIRSLRRARSRPPGRRADQQHYRLAPISGTQNQLVLGITWQTLLGEDLAREALRTAREAGATHYTQSGARSPAVGLLKTTGRESRAKVQTRLYSAAAALAQLHTHGTHVVACQLADDAVWFAVVVDGVVQAGGDRVLASMDRAQAALAEISARYGEIQIHSSDLPGARPFSLSQLAPLVNDQSALRRAAFKLSMVSPAWWAVAGLLLAYLAWDATTTWWQERQARAREAAQAMHPVVDATALWNQALATWARSVRVEGEAGLAHLLTAITQAPVAPGRWKLVEIDCLPASGSCTALYRRTRLADNHTLRAGLPSDWKIERVDLDNAKVHWSIAPPSQDRSPLALAALPTAQALDSTWIPSWQALRPALADLTLATAAPVPIPAPNMKLPNGLEQPVALPAGITLPQARTLVTNAPLRSLYALALPPTTAITQLQVRYAPDTPPGLTTSRFMATLKGTLYVQSP